MNYHRKRPHNGRQCRPASSDTIRRSFRETRRWPLLVVARIILFPIPFLILFRQDQKAQSRAIMPVPNRCYYAHGGREQAVGEVAPVPVLQM